ALGMAERLLDNDEAILYLTKAFDVVAEPKRRARIGIELGRCLVRGNRHEEAIVAFRCAREELGDADPDLTESITSELINAAWWQPEHIDVAHAELELLDEANLDGGVGSDLLGATPGY